MKLLLVEDDVNTQRVLARLLRSRWCEVTTASGVEEACGAASASSYDLVISDIGLPDGNGWDLLRRIRERGAVRAIALTGFGTADDERRSREAGFAAHLTKPVDFPALEDLIRRVAAKAG